MGNSDSKPVKKDIIVKLPLEEVVRDFFKDFLIVWHDPNSNSEENQDHSAQLEEFCQVLTFTEWEKARDYIQTTQAACHVITSGTNGELFVKEIFEKKNVCNIYVFCGNKEYHSTWAENYWKVVCVETRIETVLNQIQKNLVEWLKEEDALKLNLPAFAPIFNDWDKSQMNHLHLYLKMIPNFKNRAQAKDDFLSVSKRIYSRLGYMKDIEEFEQNYNQYSKEQILRWYTRPSFLFKVINNCLRIATSDSIQYCRLLLKDIERAIKEQYCGKSKGFNGLLYRGAYMSEQEWKSLKINRDKEIEMHGFLSVSKEKDVALNFMRFDQDEKVFITIIVPRGPNEEEQGFAELEDYSIYPPEKEILFNVRSRFTVLETDDEYSEELPYRHLVLLYGAQGFRKFIAEKKPIKNVSIQDISDISCSHCKEKFVRMSERICFIPIVDIRKQIYYCKKCLDYDAAPFLCIFLMGKGQIYETEVRGSLLMNAHQRQTPFYGYKCFNCQAKKQKMYFVCTDCGAKGKKWCGDCFERAPQCRESGHKIVLEMSPFSFWCESMSPNELNHLKFQNDLVKENNHLFEHGEMYFQSHEYEKAIKYYSLYIQENEGMGKTANLATSYNNIGRVYFDQGEYKKALEYYSQSLDICKSIYGDNHPNIATSYGNVGMVYFDQGEYKKALEYYSQSLDIYKSIYGDNHPDTATSYGNIGLVYFRQGEYKKALEYYSQSLQICKSIYADNHPRIISLQNRIHEITLINSIHQEL